MHSIEKHIDYARIFVFSEFLGYQRVTFTRNNEF